jgi:hypothetical protein
MGTAPRLGFNLARKVGGAPHAGATNEYAITSTYGTALAIGDPVQLTTDGSIIRGANDVGNLGVFAGVTYTDSSGEIKITGYWPASTVSTDAKALVIDDPLMTFHVKADGPIPLATCYPGAMYAMNLTAPDASTRRSQMTVNTIPTIVGDVDLSAVITLVGTVAGMADTDAFTIQTTNPANSATTITIATATTKVQFLAALNAVTGISATVAAGTGFLTIQTTDGYFITTASTVGAPIADLFVATSHTAAGTKQVAIAASMVKVVSIPDRDNKVMEVILTLPSVLADS